MFLTDIKEKPIGIRKHMWMLPVFLVAVVILLVAIPSTLTWASPFAETKIIFEVNSTDGDGGVQIFLDAEDWADLLIYDPDGQVIVDLIAGGSVGETGITELFFESGEPSFDDLSLAELLERFPEGKYDFEGTTVDGKKLAGKATLSHAIPAGPVIVSPEEGDAVSVEAADIIWEPVTDPFPGTDGPVDVVGYQVIVERETQQGVSTFSVDLPADATTVRVPSAFLAPHTTYKFEILAIEAGGNQTISEGEFTTE